MVQISKIIKRFLLAFIFIFIFAISLKAGTLLNSFWFETAGFSDPTDISDLLAWYDATNMGFSYNDGDKVPTWNDLSGNGHHLTQGTAANQPTFNTSVINSNDAVNFDGANDGFDLTRITGSQPVTIFYVVDFAAADSHTIIRDTTNSYLHWINSSHVPRLYYGTNASGTFNSYDTDPIMCRVVLNGASSETQTRLVWSTGLNPNTGWSYNTVARPGNADTLNGYLAELIIYEKIVTGNEQTDIETYLKNKWGAGI